MTAVVADRAVRSDDGVSACRHYRVEKGALVFETGAWPAAVAEHHGVAVIHYDHDFDRIATVTGQPVQWVIPAGSV